MALLVHDRPLTVSDRIAVSQAAERREVRRQNVSFVIAVGVGIAVWSLVAIALFGPTISP
jgi:hypothetical protein